MPKGQHNTGDALEPKKVKVNPAGLTEFKRAIVEGHVELVNTFIANNSSIVDKKLDGSLPLMVAIRNQSYEVVEILLHANANIEAIDSLGHTAFHWAACSSAECVQKFLNINANLDLRNEMQYTPLHIAASRGNLEVVQLLVNAGANITAENNNEETPIMLAFERGQHHTVDFLQRAGAVLPTYLREGRENDNVNQAQSVHAISVHVGVSKAIKVLQEHYLGSLNENQIAKKIIQANTELSQFVAALPYDEKQADVTNKNGAAKRCLAKLVNIDFTDLRSNVTLKEALPLFWLALTDYEEIRIHERLGLLKEDNELNEVELEARQAERQENAAKILTECFCQIIRGYNLNKRDTVTREFKDDGEIDNPTCISGSFNKLVYGLNNIHSLVDIPYVTNATLTKKARKCVNNIFDKLPLGEQERYAKNWTGMPAELMKHIGDELAPLLHAEFDEFKCDGFDVHQIIDEILASLEWITPKGIGKLPAGSEEETENVRRPRP